MKTYRCVHEVEAMQWHDTERNRNLFADWFESHDAEFSTLGSFICLPDGNGTVAEGEWIILMDDEFVAMENEQFVDTYTEVATATTSESGSVTP